MFCNFPVHFCFLYGILILLPYSLKKERSYIMMEPKAAFFRLSPDRQEALLSIIMQTYLDYSYENVTVRLLCEKMGINLATFYRYFESRDEMLLYIIDRLNRRQPYLVDGFPEFNAGHPDYYNDLEFAFILREADFPLSVLHDMLFTLNERMQDQYRQILTNEKARGHLRADIDIDLIAYMYATSGYNLLRYCREHNLNQQEYVKRKVYLFYSFFYYGILAPGIEAPAEGEVEKR